jgi:outer membrane protein assembly factor BamB
VPTAQILTTPVVVDGMLYVVQMTGQLYALDAATSVQNWTFTAAAPAQ